MSCVTCEITPPEGHGGPRLHDGHISARHGDTFTLGLAVLFRGQDWTLQTVEAMAGDETDGWIEVRLISPDGTPTIHPPGPHICPDCAAPRPDYDEGGDATAVFCPGCGTPHKPVPKWPAHPVTVIRQGHVQIIRGTQLITGPEPATSAV